MPRLPKDSRPIIFTFTLAVASLLSGCVVAPIAPRPVVVRAAPVYVEAAPVYAAPAPVVVVRPPPPRAYYWHRGQRHWR